MNALLIAMRLIHVISGVAWVGAAAFYLFFLSPALKAVGPLGGQVMENLVTKRNYPAYMGISSLLTVISGIYLFTFASGNFNPNWITSSSGTVFTIGSAAALVAFFMGMGMIKPRAGKIGALGKQLSMAVGAPDPDLLRVLHETESELKTIEQVEFVFLALALLAMAIARYMNF